jgi:hypothetical protein
MNNPDRHLPPYPIVVTSAELDYSTDPASLRVVTRSGLSVLATISAKEAAVLRAFEIQDGIRRGWSPPNVLDKPRWTWRDTAIVLAVAGVVGALFWYAL